MNEYKALLVAQALLVIAGSRLKLKEFHSAGEGYYRFRVAGRRGLSPKLTMPVVTQTAGLAVLSLLAETASQRHTWMFNGQADVGCNQIDHYGHSGRVICKRSKSEMLKLFGSDDFESLTKASQLSIVTAPVIETLCFFDANDELTSFELPTDPEAMTLCRALKGELMRVDDEADRYMTLVKTFGLALVFGTGQNAGMMQSKEANKAAKAA